MSTLTCCRCRREVTADTNDLRPVAKRLGWGRRYRTHEGTTYRCPGCRVR